MIFPFLSPILVTGLCSLFLDKNSLLRNANLCEPKYSSDKNSVYVDSGTPHLDKQGHKAGL